jgi:leucyl-tRNA synthetase
VSYHLRDWVISRQRYWGAPSPIVHCERCGAVPVPEKDLPVALPEISDFRPKGMSPLAAVPEFVKAKCPKCGGAARRETDTIAQWLCSCWYFLRYLSPHDAERAFDRKLADRWLPVDQYVGGIEHAVLHLLYTRFIIKVLRDAGEVSQVEPFKALFTQGMITRWAYRCPKCNSYVPGEEVHGNPAAGEATVHKKCGSFTSAEMAKMSKSWYNVVSPDALMDKYGADTQRLYTLFIGPPERDAEWNDSGVAGSSRFIHKLWDTVADWAGELRPVKPYRGPADARELTAADRAVRRKLHQTVRTVTADIEHGFQFNTAIAAIMECLTVIRANPKAAAPVRREAIEKLLLILGPFVPHVVEELWTALGNEPGVFEREWPRHDEAAAKEEELEIPVQVNGKLRGKVVVPAGAPEEAVKEQALADENVRRFTAGQEVAKVVYVPGRLVNVVVKSKDTL